MDLATGAMGSLLLKLGQLLKEEYKLQTGVKEDIQYLQRELGSMHAALRKVGDVPRDQLDQQVKLWADEVRDLSYRMEDAVDKFLVRVEGFEPAVKPVKLKRLMKKMGDLLTKGKTRHEISKDIKGIKAQVQEAADRRDRYNVTEVAANPFGATTVDPRLLALYNDQKELVGIDGALRKLTKMLADGDGDDVSKQLKKLSIFGFGGLGKTTLAKAVYDKLRAQFSCSAFVPVGRNPSMKELLNDILLEIDKQKYPLLNERQLIDKLRGLLKNKRYFIVIDDIWDTKVWKIIRCALEHNNCGSRIITTTRILEVATQTGEVYKVEPLSHDLSEELFHTRLWGGKNKCPYYQLAKDKILQKCRGVPLAIITMASLLVGKPVDVWYKVYNTIGFGYEDNEDVENTRKILLFSYYNLPCHLRTCLLYMSVYREDIWIEKDSLIWRWIAEGFIREEQGVGLFEIGERYLNELINKSLIEPAEIPHHGIIVGCRIHDMVLDMIRLLAKEENFITILDSDDQLTCPVPSNVRRIALGYKNRMAETCMEQVRSFNAMCIDEFWPSLSCFRVLRVLVLDSGNSRMENTNHLKHLGKLVHLRYLGLRGMDVLQLPKEIGNLKFLQALDLRGHIIQELPRSVGQLRHLKCLRVDETDTRMPNWIGNLTSLEELWMGQADESSDFVSELGKLTELRKLCISKHISLISAGAIKAWTESLVKLQKLQVIDIGRVKSGGYDATTYNWECFVAPHQLRVLRLGYDQPGLIARITPSLLPNLCHLSVDVDSPDLEIFGRFPELITLALTTPAGLHDAMGAPGAFPKLRAFATGGTPCRFLQGDMPSLESLHFSLSVARAFTEVDVFEFGSLVNLPLLQKVRVDILYVPGADVDKAKEAVRHAIDILPNPPILQVVTYEMDLGDSQSD